MGPPLCMWSTIDQNVIIWYITVYIQWSIIQPFQKGNLAICQNMDGPGQMAQLEHHPMYQKVVGSVPDQGTYPDYRFDPQGKYGRKSINASLSPPTHTSLPLPLKKMDEP